MTLSIPGSATINASTPCRGHAGSRGSAPDRGSPMGVRRKKGFSYVSAGISFPGSKAVARREAGSRRVPITVGSAA